MRHLRFPFQIAILTALLAACASNDEIVLEPMELQDFDATAKFDVLWSKDIGNGQDVRYTLLVPAVQGDTIYATDIEGTVYAFDRNSGKQQWKVKHDEPVSAGVGIGGGLLLLGTYDAQIIALNQNDGSEAWRASVPSEVLSPPQTNGTTVVAQTVDGQLIALDHQSGQQQWSYEASMPPLSLRGNAAPVLTNDSVYAGFANGKVYALQLSDGLLQWDQRIAVPQGRGDFEKMVDVDGAPLLFNEILFCGSFQGQIMALSRATGRPLWGKPLSTYTTMSAGQGNVYVATDDGSVKAFRTGSGELSWENNQLLRRKLNAPQAFGNYVAVADAEGGYLHLLNQSDGVFAARRKIDGAGVRSPMIAAGDVLYVLADSGDLVALKVKPL